MIYSSNIIKNDCVIFVVAIPFWLAEKNEITTQSIANRN